MTTQVTTFEDAVKAKLKDIVADLIPEERWSAIVTATVTDFEKNDLPKLVKAELTDKYKAAIAAEFAKPEWQEKWSDMSLKESDALRAMIIEAAPLVLSSLIGGAIQQVMNTLKYQVQQMPRGY